MMVVHRRPRMPGMSVAPPRYARAGTGRNTGGGIPDGRVFRSGRPVAVRRPAAGRESGTIPRVGPSAPSASCTVKPILLDYGCADPLVLEPSAADIAFDVRGPAGASGDAATALVAAAIDSPRSGPPLVAHVVPGDRVALALCGHLPAEDEIVATIRGRLVSAGVSAGDLTILHAPPLTPRPADTAAPSARAGALLFDPSQESGSAYLGPDAEGNPLHVARSLVDADVVVTVGLHGWDAGLGGATFDGDLWPAFAPGAARADVLRRLARSGRKALAQLRERSREIGWQLGTMANLCVVPGRRGTLHAMAFGLPRSAARDARRHAELWRPRLPGSARLTIASLAVPEAGLGALVRAVAAAARTTHPEGTICLASRFAATPGPVFQRWRQGVALVPLVREALASGDPTLIADAVVTRFFAQALGDRRLVLLSDLDQGVVEDLEFGHAANPEAVERLAHRADSLVVLHEADRMLPRLA